MNSEAFAIQEGICIRCKKVIEKIIVLEKMLRKMVDGTLGCSGFNMVETDALRFAIRELKERHPSTFPEEKEHNRN
jgi:hypothetical protein